MNLPAIKYRLVILPRAKLAHALWHLSRRVMPDGHSRGIYRDNDAALKAQINAYGQTLGRLAPCFHKAMQAEPILADVMQELRAAKAYAQADKIRAARATMNDAASFAFPRRYKETP